MADHTPSASPARAGGQDGAPSAWAQGEAQRLLDEAGYGYPTQEPRTYVRAIVARALDAARAEEREAWMRERVDLVARLESWLDGTLRERIRNRVPSFLNPVTVLGWLGVQHAEDELQARLAALRARGEEAGR